MNLKIFSRADYQAAIRATLVMEMEHDFSLRSLIIIFIELPYASFNGRSVLVP